jgi:hypothetical protein
MLTRAHLLFFSLFFKWHISSCLFNSISWRRIKLGLIVKKSEALASVSEGTSSESTIRDQLQQVDVLQNMGISRHFAAEIKCILDMTYRYEY